MTLRPMLPMLILLLCSCGSERSVSTHKASTADQTPNTATGRIENSIRIDTTGCLTIEQYDRTATAPASAVPGCVDLDRGVKVIGPLEVKVIRDSEYARIEVPGNGERWTSLAHLETGRDAWQRAFDNAGKK